ATYAVLSDVPAKIRNWLSDASSPKWGHDEKQLRGTLLSAGLDPRGVEFDTLLAGYLLDPAEASYPLDALCRTYLGLDVLEAAETEGEEPAEDGPAQLFDDGGSETEPGRRTGASAAAV